MPDLMNHDRHFLPYVSAHTVARPEAQLAPGRRPKSNDVWCRSVVRHDAESADRQRRIRGTYTGNAVLFQLGMGDADFFADRGDGNTHRVDNGTVPDSCRSRLVCGYNVNGVLD